MQKSDYRVIDRILYLDFPKLLQLEEYKLSREQLEWISDFVALYKESVADGILDDQTAREKRNQIFIELCSMIEDNLSELYRHVKACIDNDNLFEGSLPIFIEDIFKFDIVLQLSGERIKGYK